MADTGSITWFHVNKRMPPKSERNKHASPLVLVWGQGGWPQMTFYNFLNEEWSEGKTFPFTISHWAFINEPDSPLNPNP